MNERVGLCASCTHVKRVESGRGSTFYLCTEAARDVRLPKYPALPRRSCVGYVAIDGGEAHER